MNNVILAQAFEREFFKLPKLITGQILEEIEAELCGQDG
jgi:hypothetical protein